MIRNCWAEVGRACWLLTSHPIQTVVQLQSLWSLAREHTQQIPYLLTTWQGF